MKLLEKLAIGYLIGTGLLTLQMFLYSLLGIKFNLWGIILPWVVVLVGFVGAPFMGARIRAVGTPLVGVRNLRTGTSPVPTFLLTAAIGLKVLYVFYEALVKPVVGWDALWNFSLRAKIFYFLGGIPLDRAHPYFLGGGMKQYPLHLPLLETFTYILQGGWNDALMKVIFPLYFLSMLIVFYYALRREQSRLTSLFFTFLLSTLPLLVYHATIEYADFVVGAYFLAAVVYLYQFIKTKDTKMLILSAVLAALSAWVKDEGMVFYFIGLFLLVIPILSANKYAVKFKREFILVLYYLAPFLVLIGPWIIFKQVFGLSVGNEPTFSLAGMISGFTFHPETIPKVLEKMFLSGNWHLLFGLWALVIIFYYKQIFTTEKKYLFWSTALAILFFSFLYVFTYNWTMVFSGIIVNRNFLTLVPQVLLLCGLVYKEGKTDVGNADRAPTGARSAKSKKAHK
ncbi:hypothetical protein HZC35_07305 [Candidatus Saganbacteria bacterium]|nr:hypothetical protein [Candidatus Saganbacteria bacterium]